MTDEERDLDEARRLGYMVMVHSEADGAHDLVGTLVNAIVHHQHRASADEAIGTVLAAMKGDHEAQERLTGWLAL